MFTVIRNFGFRFMKFLVELVAFRVFDGFYFRNLIMKPGVEGVFASFISQSIRFSLDVFKAVCLDIGSVHGKGNKRVLEALFALFPSVSLFPYANSSNIRGSGS